MPGEKIINFKLDAQTIEKLTKQKSLHVDYKKTGVVVSVEIVVKREKKKKTYIRYTGTCIGRCTNKTGYNERINISSSC